MTTELCVDGSLAHRMKFTPMDGVNRHETVDGICTRGCGRTVTLPTTDEQDGYWTTSEKVAASRRKGGQRGSTAGGWNKKGSLARREPTAVSKN